jgi:hypothetical protein
MQVITDEMVKAAAEEAYGAHYERYMKMMRRALEKAAAVAPKRERCACGGVPYNPYPGWLDEQK